MSALERLGARPTPARRRRSTLVCRYEPYALIEILEHARHGRAERERLLDERREIGQRRCDGDLRPCPRRATARRRRGCAPGDRHRRVAARAQRNPPARPATNLDPAADRRRRAHRAVANLIDNAIKQLLAEPGQQSSFMEAGDPFYDGHGILAAPRSSTASTAAPRHAGDLVGLGLRIVRQVHPARRNRHRRASPVRHALRALIVIPRSRSRSIEVELPCARISRWLRPSSVSFQDAIGERPTCRGRCAR